MLTSELDYELPEHLIAQHPVAQRDESRLLVVDRGSGGIREDVFRNLRTDLNAGDCLVLNDTRVIRARLKAQKPTGGQIEIFLLRELAPSEWEALVRPSARVKPGTTVMICGRVGVQILEALSSGSRRVRFNVPDVIAALEAVGEIPLPPYIHRNKPEANDAERYQTIFARRPGAVAAPTAGLHFTPELLASLDRSGVHRAVITLHVGYGTFKPIQADRLEDHTVDGEDFELPQQTADRLNATRHSGHRVIAVGTTATRVLESQYRDGAYRAGHGVTQLYIHPPYTFRAVDALITNFHLPRSSLLALVYAFAGPDLARAAYRYAVEKEFRFYSYGDAMLIL